ncbi:MAG TPA: sulfatase-like hydrolase/transferase [Pirellulaceae bacterium]|nr:sulfatase-like hydrolase/transferase [Pirellulaceae bacterium]
MRAILAAAVMLLAAGQACGAEARPNILLIYADDQSPKTLSCYPQAYPWAKTPQIDDLARRGVRFSHCYLGSWCMPSRANMLTGRYPHAIESMRMEGEYPGSTYDPAKCPFWPRVFR